MSKIKNRKRMKNYIITDFFTNYEDITETSNPTEFMDHKGKGIK